MFIVSLVPLQLHSNENNKQIIWQNPRTSSTRYCRPIKILFAKESVELIREETDSMNQQINQLTPTAVIVEEKQLYVHTNLLMTMVDGKVCNALTENKTSQKCYICGALPKDMNKDPGTVDSITVDPTTYCFGISILHAWIRCFECLLHIAYRLDICKWQIRGESDKSKYESRKKLLRSLFKAQMGLLVDLPKPGSGTSNDGNTARRFFKDATTSANITGINEELVSS